MIGERMNRTYFPSREYSGKKEYCFIEDQDFLENTCSSLRSFLVDRSSDIRQCLTDKERVFVYINRPHALVELNGEGKFIRELEFFSKMKDFRYGEIAMNDDFMMIEDFRGPPNMYSFDLKNPLSKWKEEFKDEIRLYLYSKKDFALKEVGVLGCSVSDLTFSNEGRVFGMCNKLYPQKVIINGKQFYSPKLLRIVELTRKKELSVDSLEDELSHELITHTNPKPRIYRWESRKLFETDHCSLNSLIKTPDGNVFYYDDTKNKSFYLNKEGEGLLDAMEETHKLRSAGRFTFLDDFVVCRIHEYHGNKLPHKERIIFKGEDYSKDLRIFYYIGEILEQAIGQVFESLSYNSFIVDSTPWKFGVDEETGREEYIEWGPPTLRKFRIEAV